MEWDPARGGSTCSQMFIASPRSEGPRSTIQEAFLRIVGSGWVWVCKTSVVTLQLLQCT
jgi:hypothetical protein